MILKRAVVTGLPSDELAALAKRRGLHCECVGSGEGRRVTSLIVTVAPSSRQVFRYATNWGPRDEQGNAMWIERVAVTLVFRPKDDGSVHDVTLHCHGAATHLVLIVLLLGFAAFVIGWDVATGRIAGYGTKEIFLAVTTLSAFALLPSLLLGRWLRRTWREKRKLTAFLGQLAAS